MQITWFQNAVIYALIPMMQRGITNVITSKEQENAFRDGMASDVTKKWHFVRQEMTLWVTTNAILQLGRKFVCLDGKMQPHIVLKVCISDQKITTKITNKF